MDIRREADASTSADIRQRVIIVKRVLAF